METHYRTMPNNQERFGNQFGNQASGIKRPVSYRGNQPSGIKRPEFIWESSVRNQTSLGLGNQPSWESDIMTLIEGIRRLMESGIWNQVSGVKRPGIKDLGIKREPSAKKCSHGHLLHK